MDSIINNGHTVQVNIAAGSTVNIDGTDYELKQFHFHTPSENNINGTSYPLEAHFVHATKEGKLAVVAVMFKEGQSNPIIEKVWNTFPLEENKSVSIDLSSSDIHSIMPSDKDYYQFMGSLTTPPCSENVKWNVYKTEMTISKEQVQKFYDIFGHSNNRPLQDTNNRTIVE
jgi:carbonic anhydrase